MAAKDMAILKIEQDGRLPVTVQLHRLDPNVLQVDESYQRAEKPISRRIAANFRPEAVGTLLVGKRDDMSHWLVDGRQRCRAVIILGHREVRCNVFHSRGPEHEAEIYRLVNQWRANMTWPEKFKAMLREKHELAVAVDAAVRCCGFEFIYYRKKKGGVEKISKELTCFATLMVAARGKFGVQSITFALNTISQAWPDDPNGTNNAVVGGLARYFVLNDGVVDEEKLLPRLATVTALQVYDRARAADRSGELVSAVARQIAELAAMKRVRSAVKRSFKKK